MCRARNFFPLHGNFLISRNVCTQINRFSHRFCRCASASNKPPIVPSFSTLLQIFYVFSLLASPFFSPIHSVCIFAIFLSIFYFFLGFFATPVQIDSFRGTRLAITSKRWIVWRVKVANWLQKWFLQQFWRAGMSTAGPLGSTMAVSIHHCSLKSPSNPYFVRKFNKIHFNRLLNMLTEHMNISF